VTTGGAQRLWCNVGESDEVAGIVEMLERLRERIPGLSVILTGARGVSFPAPLPDDTKQVPKPYDLPQTVDRFLAEHAPRVTVLTASDLFPSAIAACRKIGVPIVLANASFRDRGILQERLMDFRFGARIRAFDRILAVGRQDAEHFVRKGASWRRIEVLGKMEAPLPALPCDEEEREYLAALLATRPVWLAARLPEAELESVEAAFRSANHLAHRLLLVVTPARAESGAEFAAFFERVGWVTGQRENAEEPKQDVQVYIADAPDEDGLWYRLAPITYLGGTLSGAPFPDPFHPAALGSAVLHGRTLAAPSPRLDRLTEGAAALSVADAEGLAAAVEELLSPDRSARLAGRAWDVTSQGAEAADRAAKAIAALFEQAKA
jgi:3-deoxy-D-manno-octulosonic-acid transferase